MLSGIPVCENCGKQKRGPGNELCFDCHNAVVRATKLLNRKLITDVEAWKIMEEVKSG
jgi:hypothetical protein